ncbi:MAG: glucose-1-phosphate adenylyltransferase [Candidatus Krumholzibacteriia bacterium]
MNTLQILRQTLTVILAGGQGERLYPLTRDRSKPAVPFGSVYRIIDFTLSNCINSGLRRIYVFTQYKSYSLDKHLQRGWNVFSYEAGEFLYRIPPQHRVGTKWYEGTADAVYHNVYLLEQHRPRYVLVLSGDHVYKMDYGRLLEFHRASGAPATLAAAVVPREGAQHFGIVAVDRDSRVIGFQEKPDDPPTLPDDPEHCLVNMGVYVFDTEALVREVSHDARDPESSHDFGRDLIPRLVEQKAVYAYPFRDPRNGMTAYWRDIGTLDSYYDASMDLVARQPQLDLYDQHWAFRAWQPPVPPAKSAHGFVEDGQLPGTMENSIVGGGSVISGGRVERSILGRGVRVNSYSKVRDSIIMDGVQVGRYAELDHVICDKEVIIPEGMKIGGDTERDRRLFRVTDRGIVVIPKGMDLRE